MWHKQLFSLSLIFSLVLIWPNIFFPRSFCYRLSSSSPIPPPPSPPPPPPLSLFTACYLHSAVDCFCPLGVSTRLILHSAIQPRVSQSPRFCLHFMFAWTPPFRGRSAFIMDLLRSPPPPPPRPRPLAACLLSQWKSASTSHFLSPHARFSINKSAVTLPTMGRHACMRRVCGWTWGVTYWRF